MKRHQKTLLILVLVILLATILSATIYAKEYHYKAKGDIKETITFRKQFNLSTDIEEIEKINYKSDKFGVYLTPEEENMLKEKFNRQNKEILEITKYIKDHFKKSELGSLYIDQAAGGIINIGFTNELLASDKRISKLKEEIENKIISPVNLKSTTYSLEELNQVFEAISSDLPDLADQQEIKIFMVTINTPKNSVDVYVEDLKQESVDYLVNKYGN